MTIEEQPNRDWRVLYPFAPHRLNVGGGASMHYVDEGQGEPVVMLHGNPTWSFHFRDLVAELRQTHRAIAPDHVGFGLSEKPQVYPYRLKTHIDNLESLLVEHLDLRGMTLVLHDWGGAIGCGFAVRHPDRVARLVVFNSAAFVLPDCPLRVRLCRLPVVGTLAVRSQDLFLRAAISMATQHPDRFSERVRDGYLAPYNCFRNRVAIHRIIQDLPLNPTSDTWRLLSDIEDDLSVLADRPTLICWGNRDFCFPPDVCKMWRKRFPDAEVHSFDDAGHFVLEDAKEFVVPLVKKHLGAGAQAPPSQAPVQKGSSARS